MNAGMFGMSDGTGNGVSVVSVSGYLNAGAGTNARTASSFGYAAGLNQYTIPSVANGAVALIYSANGEGACRFFDVGNTSIGSTYIIEVDGVVVSRVEMFQNNAYRALVGIATDTGSVGFGYLPFKKSLKVYLQNASGSALVGKLFAYVVEAYK